MSKYQNLQRWLSVLVGTASFACTVQAGPVLDRIRANQTVTIGYRANSAPFSYEDKGHVVGYAIDVCQRIATALQQQLKLPKLAVRYVPVTTADRIPALLEGRIDLECAGSTNTKARREQVAFGLTYFYAGASILVREGEGIDGFASLRGKVLAAVKGTTGLQVAEMRVRDGRASWKVEVFESTRAAVDALEQGKADAAIQDNIQLLPLARQSSKKLALAGQPLSIEPLAPMFARNDPELAELVLAAMRQIYRDGEMGPLYDRWFIQQLPGRNFKLDLKLNPLLNDNFRRPSSYVTDWVVL